MCTRANTLHNGVEILNKFQLEKRRAAQQINTGKQCVVTGFKRIGGEKQRETFCEVYLHEDVIMTVK